jgi:redox-sensitive bicupin YhaK (pirin superfamily)
MNKEAGMFQVRKSCERGHANHGWLDTYHTFSFADYYDPAQMGFGPLRVINEDRVEPGKGFGTHGHRDMEILTVVLDGGLQHRDNLGNGSVIRPGDVQRMSAGTGVLHSEFNASDKAPVHFLQIWIEPSKRGVRPGYEQKHIGAEERRGRLRLLASPDGRDESVTIHQDARVYVTDLAPDEAASHDIEPKRRAYVHVARGAVTLNGKPLEAGDGASIVDETTLNLLGLQESQVLLFDLP